VGSDIAELSQEKLASRARCVSLDDHQEASMPSACRPGLIMFCAVICSSAISAASEAGVPGGGVGYPELLARLGENTPTGAGVRVGQVELPDGEGDYGPNQSASSEYAGKNFTFMNGPTGTSAHANVVARNYYGNVTSIAPGVTDINLYLTTQWIDASFLRSNSASSTPPLAPPAGLRIFNNSWVGNSPALSIVRRADYAARNYDVLMVNGVNVSSAPSDNWPLLSHMYNGISVGKTNGVHQSGDTLSDGVGRMKPEIVAPGSETSYSAAVVSAAAALMYETAGELAVAGTNDASRSEVIKAVLMAGARHRAGWTNNPDTAGPTRGVTDRPLDDIYGVDVVNVDRSHMILTGGEFPGLARVPSFATAASAGWALESVAPGAKRYWRFSVFETANEVSILATWHRDAPIGFSTSFLANFDLQLWRVDASGQLVSLVGSAGLSQFTAGNVVSNSSVDNVEHLYIQNLAAGSYVLELARVDTLSSYPTWDVAIAWLFPPMPCLADLVTTATVQPPPDGVVDGADLASLLSWWGPHPESFADIVDNNTLQPPPDGVVDGADLAFLLANWGACP